MLRKTLYALATIVLLAAFGCSNDPSSPNNDAANAPALPAASTMQVNLAFPGVGSAAFVRDRGLNVEPSHANWIAAYTRSVYIVLTTYDTLEEPIGAFAAAIHSVPQHQEDGSYLWTYIYVDPQSGVEYQIFLYGTRSVEGIAWRMEVSSNSQEQPLDHFVWFDGESALGGRSGYWQFYTPVTESTGVASARIDWSRELGDRRLTIVVNGEGFENQGDSLDFHETTAQNSIVYYDASAAATQTITWHPDGSGFLTVPDYNGGATACWDTQQVDTACE